MWICSHALYKIIHKNYSQIKNYLNGNHDPNSNDINIEIKRKMHHNQ